MMAGVGVKLTRQRRLIVDPWQRHRPEKAPSYELNFCRDDCFSKHFPDVTAKQSADFKQ